MDCHRNWKATSSGGELTASKTASTNSTAKCLIYVFENRQSSTATADAFNRVPSSQFDSNCRQTREKSSSGLTMIVSSAMPSFHCKVPRWCDLVVKPRSSHCASLTSPAKRLHVDFKHVYLLNGYSNFNQISSTVTSAFILLAVKISAQSWKNLLFKIKLNFVIRHLLILRVFFKIMSCQLISLI